MPQGRTTDVDWNAKFRKRLVSLPKEVLVDMYLRQRTGFLKPPPGWSLFGTHIDERYNDQKLEFWGEDVSEDGLPLWERLTTQIAFVYPPIMDGFPRTEEGKPYIAGFFPPLGQSVGSSGPEVVSYN